MEVPRVGVELELQVSAYTIASQQNFSQLNRTTYKKNPTTYNPTNKQTKIQQQQKDNTP